MNTNKMNMKKLICGTLTALVACTSWATANVTWSLGGAFEYEPAAGVWVGSSEGGGEQITSGRLYLCFTTPGSGDDMISQLTKSFADGGLEDAGVDAMTAFLSANSQWNGYNANNPNFSANCYSQTGGAFGTPSVPGQDSPAVVTINGIDMDKSYDVAAIIFDTQDITADSKYVVIKGFGELDFYMESDKGQLEVGFGTEWYEGDIDHGMAAPNNAVDGQWHAVGIGGEAVGGKTVAVTANAKDNTTVGGVYTNGVAIAATEDGTYVVEQCATVSVVFNADTGYYFESADAIYGYTTTLTNEIEASEDTEVAGPTPVAGTQVGDSAYLVMKDGVCTILGTGAIYGDKRIGDFVDKDSITSLVIADGVTAIAPRFFKKCYKLESVTGGKDLVSIGEGAFYLCMRLATIDLGCTTIPAGLDQSVVYRTVLDTNSGAGYTIPAISVANHQRMLRAKKALADAEWTDLGSPEGKNLFETGYNFFKIDLVPDTAEIAADVNGSEDSAAGTDGMIAVNDAEDDSSGDTDAPAWGEFD